MSDDRAAASAGGLGHASALPQQDDAELASTARLLSRIRQGDRAAREILLRRYLPILRRWAHGRLPAFARPLLDTDDLVQITLVRTLDHLEEFEPEHEGAFLAYLRRALKNRITDEIRSARRKPGREVLSENVTDPGLSPLEQLVNRELLDRYELALGRLTEEQQEAIVMRVEMGLPYRDIAMAQARPSDNAARQFVVRALAQLAVELHGKR